MGVNFIHTSWVALSIGGKAIQPVNSKILHSSLITHHSSLSSSSSSSSSSSWSSSWSWSWLSSWSVVVVVVVVAVLAAAAKAAVAWVDGERWKHYKLSISSFHPLINTSKHQRVKSRFSHKSDVSNHWILEIQPWNLLIHRILVVAAPSDPRLLEIPTKLGPTPHPTRRQGPQGRPQPWRPTAPFAVGEGASRSIKIQQGRGCIHDTLVCCPPVFFGCFFWWVGNYKFRMI